MQNQRAKNKEQLFFSPLRKIRSVLIYVPSLLFLLRFIPCPGDRLNIWNTRLFIELDDHVILMWDRLCMKVDSDSDCCKKVWFHSKIFVKIFCNPSKPPPYYYVTLLRQPNSKWPFDPRIISRDRTRLRTRRRRGGGAYDSVGLSLFEGKSIKPLRTISHGLPWVNYDYGDRTWSYPTNGLFEFSVDGQCIYFLDRPLCNT